jgi:hypothetical protein
MWKDPTERKDFVFMILMGLRKALSLIPIRKVPVVPNGKGLNRYLTEEQEKQIADAIARELETTNWKIEKGPPGAHPSR